MVAKTNENASKEKKEDVVELGIDKLKYFENHPFKIVDEDLSELMESISQNGVTTPLVVRPLKDGNYEIVSGHRRKRACELLEIKSVPCIVRNMTRDEAIIMMVDSNIQREEILPSERAFAYKMKLDAMKHQGKKLENTSDQVGRKLETTGIIGKETGDSQTQVKRYIRLTYLIPELLEMVDSKRIALTPAVELSYLRENEQKLLLNIIDYFGQTPSTSQAQDLKKLSESYELNEDSMEDIMCEEKANQIPKINISYGRIKSFVPRSVVTPKEVETYLIKCAIVCRQRGINVEKLDIDIDGENIEKPKSKDRDSR